MCREPGERSPKDDGPEDEELREAPTANAGNLAEVLAAGRAAGTAETPPPALGPDLFRPEGFGLLGVIAHGPRATVYRAHQESDERIVALKVMSPGSWVTEDDLAQFRSGADAAARLEHPGVVKVLGAGEEQGHHYVVMEYVDGTSLAELVRRGPLPPARAAQYVKSVAEALHYAHQQGVVHRDLKPSNIRIRADGEPVIVDFGLAVRTRDGLGPATGRIVGTPGYIPPEQASGRLGPASPSSDVYSLGAVLYELLTGRPPFFGGTVLDVLNQGLAEEPESVLARRPEAGRDLDTICLKCLRKDPGERYASAKALADDLGRYLSDRKIQARAPGLLSRLRVSRRCVVTGFGLALVVLALVVSWVMEREQSARLIAGIREDVAAARRRSEDYAQEVGQLRNQLDRHEESIGKLQVEVREHRVRTASLEVLLHAREALETDLQRSLLLALQVVAIAPKGAPSISAAAEQVLRDALGRLQVCTPLHVLKENRRMDKWALSPNSRWLVTNIDNAPMHLWDLSAEKPFAAPTVLGNPRHELCRTILFTRDSRWLLTFGGPYVRSWDFRGEISGSAKSWFAAHRHCAYALAISPDGKWLATGGDEKMGRLWKFNPEGPAGTPVDLPGHDDFVTMVAFSSDSKWVITVDQSRKGVARLWRVDAPAPPASPFLLAHQTRVYGILFTADGRRLITKDTGKAIYLWDLTSEDPSRGPEILHLDARPREFAISPDDHWLVAVTEDRLLRLWDRRANKPLSASEVVRGRAKATGPVCFSPDSRWLVTGSSDRSIRVWDLAAPNPWETPMVLSEFDHEPTGATFTGDGGRLITSDWPHTRHNPMVKVWEFPLQFGPVSPRIFGGHTDAVTRVALTCDDGRLVAASGDGTARIWSLATGKGTIPPTVLRGHEGKLHALAISPDDHWLATAGEDRTVRLWDLTAAALETETMVLEGHEDEILAAAFSPGNRWLATGARDGSVRLWDLSTETPAASSTILSGHAGAVTSLFFTPDSRRLVTTGSDKTVRSWTLSARASTEASFVLQTDDGRPALAAAISRNGKWLATGSEDGTVRLWDLATDPPEDTTLLFKAHDGAVRVVAFSPDQSWLIAAGAGKTAGLLDLTGKRPRPRTVLRGHDDGITSMATSLDGRWLVTGSDDGTARVWDLSTGDGETSSVVLRGHTAAILDVTITSDSRLAITSSKDGTIRVWPLRLDEVVAAAQGALKRELSQEEQERYFLGGAFREALP